MNTIRITWVADIMSVLGLAPGPKKKGMLAGD